LHLIWATTLGYEPIISSNFNKLILNITKQDYLYLTFILIILIAGLYGDSVSEYQWFNISLAITILLMAFAFFQISRSNNHIQVNKSDLLDSKKHIIEAIKLKKQPELEKQLENIYNQFSEKLNSLHNEIISKSVPELNKQLNELKILSHDIDKGFLPVNEQLIELKSEINKSSNSKNEISTLVNEYQNLVSKSNTENVRLLNSIQAETHNYLEFIRAKQLPQMKRHLEKGIRDTYNQVDALLSIYATFDIQNPMPIFRGWAISPDIAKTIAEVIFETKPNIVVSLGSGVSDLVVGYSLQKVGNGQLYSIEHDHEYAEKTRRTIDLHNLNDFVKVETAELVNYTIDNKEWKWYGYDIEKLPGKINLLIIDGPPGNTQHLARYPALPLLHKYMAEGCIIILDDAIRDQEKEIMAMWAAQFENLQYEYLNNEKGAFFIKNT
jgi:predicted O-methyltransferase YrrM